MAKNTELTVDLARAARLTQTIWESDPHKPVMFHGPTGVGKSQIFRSIRKNMEKELGVEIGFIDFRGSQREPSDISGALMPTESMRTVSLTSMDLPYEKNSRKNMAKEKAWRHYMIQWERKFEELAACSKEEVKLIQERADYLLENDETLEGYPEHGILFFDEIKHSDQSMQNALFGVLSDREISGNKLMDGWRVAAAGNRSFEATYDNNLPAPLRARIAHMFINPTTEQWAIYAAQTGLRPEVATYLRNGNDLHAETKETAGEGSFRCGRQWESVAKLIDVVLPLNDKGIATMPPTESMQWNDNMVLIQSLIGTTEAAKFVGYLQLCAEDSALTRYSVDEILANPALVKNELTRSQTGKAWSLVGRMLHRVQELGKTIDFDMDDLDTKDKETTKKINKIAKEIKKVADFFNLAGEGNVWENAEDISRGALTLVRKTPAFDVWWECERFSDETDEWHNKFEENYEGITQ